MSTTSGLHQIGIRYDPVEDRAILRLGSRDKSEWRLTMTRRFVRLLWNGLTGALDHHSEIRTDLAHKTREAMLAMQHQAVVQTEDFNQPFAEDTTDLTSNTGPQLVVGANVRPLPDSRTEVRFRTAGGMDIAFTVDRGRLHAFCHLLVQCAVSAEWNLPLAVGDAATTAPSDTNIH
ncbi:MAG: hypothetical protein FJX42_08275 [Alphaproteobacteria bacterium]|nr:hypothetical protein [Alphaproteobacteria bacterium]